MIERRRRLRSAFSTPLSGMKKTSTRFIASIAWIVRKSGFPAPMPMIKILRFIGPGPILRLRAAGEPGGERFEPRAERLEARGYRLSALFGRRRALPLGLRCIAGLRETVGDRQGGHDDKTLIADLAERRAHFADLAVDHAGQRFKPRFLALVAGEAVFAAVDRHRNLRHGARLFQGGRTF